jgi:tetratricopeptide (TPR) repeat protein
MVWLNIYNLSGLLSAENGNMEAAQRLFETAIEKDSNYVDAQRNLAEVLLARDHFDEGVQLLINILKQFPEDVPSLFRMAELNLEADRPKDAAELLRKVLEIAPEHAQAKQILETMET